MKGKILKYLFIFFMFLIFNLIISPLNLEEIWSYGFTNNIYSGLIPYKDFNMVITPFYPFFMSLLFHIFGNNMLVFYIENAFLIVGFIYICDCLLKDKFYILLFSLIFPLNITFPNYNFLLLFFFVLLVYLERNNKNDYLIGVLLAFVFLTKQTVGIPLLIVSLYYFKNKKKLLKRFIGFIIPNILFLFYLLITNSFNEFFDLCFLGLFDFGKGNTNIFNIYFFITIFLLITILIFFKKNKKIDYIYLLMFISICIPLFDLYHFLIYLEGYLIIVILNNNISIFKPKLIGISLFIGIFSIYMSYCKFDFNYYPNDLNLFEYRYIEKDEVESNKKVIKYMNKYNNKVMFIGPNAYYYKLISNQKINYTDLINNGNWGYNGSNKLLEYVKSLDKSYVFFIKKEEEMNKNDQTDQNLIKYIVKNGKKIDKVDIYDIYKLGEEDD